MARIRSINRWVAKGRIRQEGDCWLWTGAKTRNGYGQVMYGGRHYMTHRFIYETLVGEIPAGLDLDHLCRHRACVNPWHAEPVSRSVNLLRGTTTRTHNSSKTHCPHGHPYDESNTRRTPVGGRACRACDRVRAAAIRARRVA